MVNFVNTYIGFFLVIVGFISWIVGVILQDKYDLGNRIRKRIAIVFNRGANARMAFTYETDKDFKTVKNEILNLFNNPQSKIDNALKLDFSNRYYSICVFKEPEGNINIEVERIDAGLKDLRKKIEEMIQKLEYLNNKGVLNSLIGCKLDIELPFSWKLVRMKKPKGFEIKNILVNLEDSKNTKIRI